MKDRLAYVVRKVDEMNKKLDMQKEVSTAAQDKVNLILRIVKSKLTESDEIMHVDDVVELLNLSRGTVHKATKNKELPHVKLGGTVLYLRSTVYDLFKKKKGTED